MKVSVYPEKGGTFSVLVQATPGKGRPPVLLQGVKRQDIAAVTLPEVIAARRPKGAPLPQMG